MAVERIVGIDFGTSTSVVRVKRYQDGKPVGDGGRLDTKELIFGGLYQTVPTLIQKIGENTKYGYDAQPSKKAVMYQGFKVDLESDDLEKKQKARELTEEFLHYLATVYREQSDGGHLGENEDKERTMISYPVKWSDETKSFMLEAARKAGFPNVEGMDEAQAAIHAVTLQSEDFLKNKGYLTNGKPSTILLIDMGAGTTDLVLCRYTLGTNPTNEILCTWPKSGQILFGGQEADEVLRQYIRSILPAEDADKVMSRLDRRKNNYKTWKETVVSPALSRHETVEEFYELDSIVDSLGVEVDEYALDRAGFETFAKDYLSEFPQLVRGCLKEAHISEDEVDLAILTGGHSQWYFASEMLRGGLPQICEALLPKTKAEPGRIISVTRPQETVALGLVYSPMSVELKPVQEEIIPAGCLFSEEENGYVLQKYTGEEEYFAVPEYYREKLVVAIADRCFINFVPAADSTDDNEKGTFEGNLKLRSIRVPGSCKRIGDQAFVGCKNIVEVIMEEGIEEIGSAAFLGCENLMHLEIPGSCNKIDGGAFLFCKKIQLPIFNMNAIPAYIGDKAFEDDILKKLGLTSSIQGEESKEKYTIDDVPELAKTFIAQQPWVKQNSSIFPLRDLKKLRTNLAVPSNAEVYLAIDNQGVFSYGKNGFIMTNFGIYVKNMLGGPQLISWQEYLDTNITYMPQVQYLEVRFKYPHQINYTGSQEGKDRIYTLLLRLQEFLLEKLSE